jgi:hypothetical protein
MAMARRPSAGHDVLALSIEQEIDVELVHACSGVAAEGDTCSGFTAGITKDHGLDGNSSPFQVIKAIESAIRVGSRALPGPVDRLGGCNDEMESSW